MHRVRARKIELTLQVAVIGIDGSGKSTLAASLAAVLAGEYGLVAGSAVADEFWVRAPDTDLCGPRFHPHGYAIAARLERVSRKFCRLVVDNLRRYTNLALRPADNLFRVAFRCKPHDIDMPIVIVPVAESVFGKELADQWFDLFYQPMLKHLDEFPDDTLIGNNTAWFAASCNRHLVKAQSLASKIALSSPDPTYLDTLAEVEYRLGNIARAIELSERCLQIEPKGKQHRDQLKRFRAGKP